MPDWRGVAYFSGVGLFVANARNAEGAPLGGLPALVELAREGALRHVFVQTRGGADVNDNVARLDGWRARLAPAGVRVHCWVFCDSDPDGDAQHVLALRGRVDGAVLNCEDAYEYGHAGAAAFDRTRRLLEPLRGRLPLALSTYNFPSRWALDWRAFEATCGALLPQAYVNEQPDWTPAALVKDAFKAAQLTVGWWYRVRFTNGSSPALRWCLVEGFDAKRSWLVVKDGLNRWRCPVTVSAAGALVPRADRAVVNAQTGKLVGELLGQWRAGAVFPTLPTYAGRLGRPSAAELGRLVAAARVAGASLYLGELSSPDDVRAVAASLAR